MWNIFENCWLMLTLAGIALIAASLVRQEKPEWGLKPLLAPLLLAALAFGLDYFVTTDYEAVSAIVPACKKAAVAADTDAIIEYISPDYADKAHRSRAAIINRIERVIPQASIKKIRLQNQLVTINGDQAESEFLAAVHLNPNSQYSMAGSLVFVEMKFEYKKNGQTWQIQRMDVTAVNYQPMDWGGVP